MADLAGGRLLVDAALAALLELEVLDRIGQVARPAVDPGLRHGAGQATAPPARRRGGPAGPPDRRAARRRRRWSRRPALRRAPPGSRPGTSGSVRRMMAFSCVEGLRILVGHRGDGAGGFAACGHGRLPLDHRFGAPGRRPDQGGDRGGLGHVAPVLLGHLGPHGLEVGSGRVERALVIGLPAGLEPVALGELRPGRRAARRSGSRCPNAPSRRASGSTSACRGSGRRRTAPPPPGCGGRARTTRRSARRPPSSARRKRRKACILWRSRPIAFAIRCRRWTSGSLPTSIRCRSPWQTRQIRA